MDDLQTKLANKLSELMTTLQLEDAPAGGCVVVYHQGKQIAAACVGQATPNQAWHANTLSLNYSTGKGVLVTLVHILVSNNLLDYDTPIADYWPPFGINGKSDITLKTVLTHRSGLFNIQAITDEGQDMLDWPLMLNKVAAMSPEVPINKKAESCYSALVSGWVLGGLIEKVTGLTLNEALDKYLTIPLGCQGEMYFGVPKTKLSQVATLTKKFDEFDEQLNGLIDSDFYNGDGSRDSSALQNKAKSSKPKLRKDTPAISAAYKQLPSYDCWQHLAVQEKLQKKASVDDSDKKESDKDANNSAKPLSTLEIAKLYFAPGAINLQDYMHALVPTGHNNFDYYAPNSLMAKIPAANGVASAQALAKMYAMLANKGVWQQQTLICPKVFEKLSTIYVHGSDAVMSSTHPQSMQWRLGYHRLFSRCYNASNLKSAFGHMGYNGSVAWCDSERELAVAFVHNFDITMSTDIRQFAIIEAILKWIDAGM